jgi:NitT/TauT family transport system substrate-binding protein
VKKFIWIGCALLVWLALPLAAAADPVRLRMPYVAVPGQLVPILYERKDILKHYGTSYTVDAIRLPGSGPQLTALAAGELEAAIFAPAAFALAIQNAHMDDIRVVADITRDGYQDYHTRKFMVLTNSPIRKVEDLKGKVIASNSIGGAMDMGMRSYLGTHGLQDKRDFSVVEIDFANQLPALTAGKSDLAFMTIPFSIPPIRAGTVRTLFTMKQAMGGASELSVMCLRASFIAAHRAALVDFFEDTQRALRWFLDPNNRGAVLEIVSRFTKRPASAYVDWLFTKEDDYHDVDARVDLRVMQRDIDTMRKTGMMKIAIDVKKYADLSLVEDAVKRLR